MQNPVARIMPNTNAQVGHSVTGISFSNNFDPKSKDEINDLVKAFGSVIEVSEDHLHQVTAITGSLAQHFYIMYSSNTLKAGTKLGLEKNKLKNLYATLL